MILEYGGADLEHTTIIKNFQMVSSVLLQIILSLAQAEVELEFEHRDLHWGNILVDIDSSPEPLVYTLGMHNKSVDISFQPHIMVKIIDFNLSRLKNGSIIL